MRAREENVFSMYLSVEEVCTNNNGVWAGTPAFGTAFTGFTTSISDIQGIRLEQEKDLKGIAEQKSLNEDVMISKTLVIAKAIVAFASVTNDPVLRQEIDYSDSELRKTRDTVLETKCQIVHDRANTHAAALVPYGITAGMITDLQTAIDDFHATIAGPRSAISVRKTYTEQLDNKLKETTKILSDQLDNLVPLFQGTAPNFVSDYNNARIIIDLGGGANTFTGSVAAGSTKNITDTANNDSDIYQIKNTGLVSLKFGRGADSTDMGNGVGLNAGEVHEFTALELGATGNKFLNVQNLSGSEGSYKVVRE